MHPDARERREALVDVERVQHLRGRKHVRSIGLTDRIYIAGFPRRRGIRFSRRVSHRDLSVARERALEPDGDRRRARAGEAERREAPRGSEARPLAARRLHRSDLRRTLRHGAPYVWAVRETICSSCCCRCTTSGGGWGAHHDP